jgi:hypothetical protein
MIDEVFLFWGVNLEKLLKDFNAFILEGRMWLEKERRTACSIRKVL